MKGLEDRGGRHENSLSRHRNEPVSDHQLVVGQHVANFNWIKQSINPSGEQKFTSSRKSFSCLITLNEAHQGWISDRNVDRKAASPGPDDDDERHPKNEPCFFASSIHPLRKRKRIKWQDWEARRCWRIINSPLHTLFTLFAIHPLSCQAQCVLKEETSRSQPSKAMQGNYDIDSLEHFLITVFNDSGACRALLSSPPPSPAAGFIIPRPEWCCLINEAHGFIHLFCAPHTHLRPASPSFEPEKAKLPMGEIHHRENLGRTQAAMRVEKKENFITQYFPLPRSPTLSFDVFPSAQERSEDANFASHPLAQVSCVCFEKLWCRYEVCHRNVCSFRSQS